MVSLPSKWVKKFNIKKGDELELIEEGKDLVIKTGDLNTKEGVILDIGNFNNRSVMYAASALHKIGYDEITLLYNNKKQIDLVNELLRVLLLGFVMVDQTPKKLVLRSVTNEVGLEFDSTLRRAFLVTMSLADSSLENLNNNNFKDLQNLIGLENTNNQLTSFCTRLINKGFYKDTKKSQFISIIIWSLEKIADEYKYICLNLSKNKTKIDDKLLEIYSRTNKFFNSYYELFYKFDITKLNELSDEREAILGLVNNMVLKNSNEIKLLNNLTTIISKVSDLSSSIFALHCDNLKELKKPTYGSL